MEARGIATHISAPEVLPLEKTSIELVHQACGEALANVLRHANASHVSVHIVVENERVVVTIEDDGRGFTPEDLRRRRAEDHFGTRLLEDKAELAGGAFSLESEPGRGSRVGLWLPVAASDIASTSA